MLSAAQSLHAAVVQCRHLCLSLVQCHVTQSVATIGVVWSASGDSDTSIYLVTAQFPDATCPGSWLILSCGRYPPPHTMYMQSQLPIESRLRCELMRISRHKFDKLRQTLKCMSIFILAL